MRSLLHLLGAAVIAFTCTACVADKHESQNPEISSVTRRGLMQEAEEYLHQTQLENGLPGITKEDHVLIHVVSGPVTVGWLFRKHVVLPASFTAVASTEGDMGQFPLYRYVLTKEHNCAAWQLVESWRIDGKDTEVKLQ